MTNIPLLKRLRDIQHTEDIVTMKRELGALISSIEVPPMEMDAVPVEESKSSLQTKLIEAVEMSNVSVLSELFQDPTFKIDISRTLIDASTGVTVLHRAVEIGNVPVIEVLMRRLDEESSAAIALHNLSGDMLRKSLRKRLNPQTTVTGYTPLHFAVMGSSDKVMLELIKRGADADIASTDEEKVTPFLMACELGQDRAVSMMIQLSKGACLHSTDAQGNTGLHLAAENEHEHIVDLLMNVMPSLSREENNDGNTAVDLALGIGNGQLALHIEEMGHHRGDSGNVGEGGFVFG